MEKYAQKVKSNIESLLKLGVKVDSLGGWIAVLKKLGDYENVVEMVVAARPKAVEAAKDSDFAQRKEYLEFTGLRQQALVIKPTLKPTVETLVNSRAKLPDFFKAVTDVQKNAAAKKAFANGTPWMKALAARILEEDSDLAPVTPPTKRDHGVIPEPTAKPNVPKKPSDYEAIPETPSTGAKKPSNVYGGIPLKKNEAPTKPSDYEGIPEAPSTGAKKPSNVYGSIPLNKKEGPKKSSDYEGIPETASKKPSNVYGNIPGTKNEGSKKPETKN